MKYISLLGATGSIGASTLKVIRKNPENFKLHSVIAKSNSEKMVAICREFLPCYAVMTDEKAATIVRNQLKEQNIPTTVLSTETEIAQIVAMDEVDLVVAAIVGAAGFLSSLAAVRAGKTILLANKETLVIGGQLFMNEVQQHQATILPLDSEHNALFQCLPKQANGQHSLAGVDTLILTASGGPFRTWSQAELRHITKADALRHPRWEMGAKVTIDSSTLMNKGLELIEASFLFGLPERAIEVVIHPQSIIHSLVRYKDGSLLAQLGTPDMAIPIAHALGYPERIFSGATTLDLVQLGQLTFEAPDLIRFPCLRLAREALVAGNQHLVALNAINEVLVAAFLNDQISYCEIPVQLERALGQIKSVSLESIEDLMAFDHEVRIKAQEQFKEVESA